MNQVVKTVGETYILTRVSTQNIIRGIELGLITKEGNGLTMAGASAFDEAYRWKEFVDNNVVYPVTAFDLGKPMKLDRLAERALSHPLRNRYYRVATQQGWLTNGMFLAKLTSYERDRIKLSFSRHIHDSGATDYTPNITMLVEEASRFPKINIAGPTALAGKNLHNIDADVILVEDERGNHYAVQADYFYALLYRYPYMNIVVSNKMHPEPLTQAIRFEYDGEIFGAVMTCRCSVINNKPIYSIEGPSIQRKSEDTVNLVTFGSHDE